MTHVVLIKAPTEQIAKIEAAVRGITLANVRLIDDDGEYMEVIARTDTPLTRLQNWTNEQRHAPYPVGTLLLFTPLKDRCHKCFFTLDEHDPFDNACPDDADHARLNAQDNVSA